MKKKIVASMLSIAMLLTITGCSGSSETDFKSSVAENKVTESPATEGATEQVTPSESEAKEIFLGTVNGDSYTNDYFGFKVNTIDGFSFADDELIKLIGFVSAKTLKESKTITGKNVAQSLESGTTITDCLLKDNDLMNSLSVTLGSIDKSFTNDDLEYLLDNIIPSLKPSLNSLGAQDLVCERSTTTFCGAETPCIIIEYNTVNNGVALNMHMIEVLIVKDGYSATITAQAVNENDPMTLLNTVSSIK